jgi:exosortase
MNNDETTPLDSALTRQPDAPMSRDTRRRWGLGILALGLIVYAYAISRVCLFQVEPTSVLGWLWVTWGKGPDNAHGYLVPIVAAGVFYWKWQTELRRLPMESSGWGLAVIGVAMFLYFAGARGQENRILAGSFPLLMFGVILYLGGWPWAKAAWFPCVFLLFMIPFSFIDPYVGFPLRMFVARTATFLLNLFSPEVSVQGKWMHDVYNQGTGILSHSGRFKPLDVADPCSGIRSLTALMALTALYGYIAMDRPWKKWVLFTSSIPLAVVGNLARIATVALVAQGFGGEWAMKVYHDFSGYIVFILAILCMLGLGTLVNLHYRDLINHWLQDEAPPPAVLPKRR